MLYFSDVSDVLLQSIFKLNDDEKLSTSITISESQLVIMVKFNCMIKKKVNWIVPLPLPILFNTYTYTHIYIYIYKPIVYSIHHSQTNQNHHNLLMSTKMVISKSQVGSKSVIFWGKYSFLVSRSRWVFLPTAYNIC